MKRILFQRCDGIEVKEWNWTVRVLCLAQNLDWVYYPSQVIPVVFSLGLDSMILQDFSNLNHPTIPWMSIENNTMEVQKVLKVACTQKWEL